MKITKQTMTALLREMFGEKYVRPFYNGWLIWRKDTGKCTFCSNDEIAHMMNPPTR